MILKTIYHANNEIFINEEVLFYYNNIYYNNNHIYRYIIFINLINKILMLLFRHKKVVQNSLMDLELILS